MPVIQHFALNCRDRKAQERFFRKHFGFVRARVFNHNEPNEFVMLKLEDFRLELFSSNAEPDAAGGEQPIGFKHLAFAVDSLEQKIEELEADGITPDPIIDCNGICPGMRVVFFRDPEGNILELMQGYADQDNVPELT